MRTRQIPAASEHDSAGQPAPVIILIYILLYSLLYTLVCTLIYIL